MRLLNLLRKLIIDFYSSFRRFPVSITFSTVAAVIAIIVFHNEREFSRETRDILTRIIMVLALGIPISLCIRLIFEKNRRLSTKSEIFAYLASCVLLVLYYLYLLKDFDLVSIGRFIALNFFFYLVFMIIPCFYKRNGFELYIIRLMYRFFVTVLFSGILFVGISAILFTIDKLLGVNINEKLYFEIWIAIVGIFAPCFYLAGIPLLDFVMDEGDYPKLLKVLLLYIVIPLIIAYTLILYIYFGKVIVTLIWPVGLVANLVLWYSVICAVVFFFTYPLSGSVKWLSSFVSILSKLVIPLIAMMFVSLGIRVKAYGITENRYYVMILGIWVLGVMLYQTLARNKRNIILPISLAIITILSVFGPQSSFSISKFSQNSRLEKLLIKNNMLKDSKIIANTSVPSGDREEMSRILGYFSQNHKLKDVRFLPGNFKIGEMEKIFGFPYNDFGGRINGNNYFYYNLENKGNALDIKGYDYLFMERNYTAPMTQQEKGLNVRYDPADSSLKVVVDGRELYKTRISDFIGGLYKKYGVSGKGVLPVTDLTFTDENDRLKLRLVFQNVSGQEDKVTGAVNVGAAEFYVLVRIK